MNTCQPIHRILKLAEAENNTILNISKSQLMDKVMWMNNALSFKLKSEIQLDALGLEYQKTVDQPHNPASEYFICNECKAAIVFPLRTAQ